MEKDTHGFLLRVESELFKNLKAKASAQKISINELCKSLLKKEYSDVGAALNFQKLTSILKDQAGIDLIGVVLFGSTARGTATPDPRHAATAR